MSLKQTPKEFNRDSIGFRLCKNYEELIAVPVVEEVVEEDVKKVLTIHEKINLRSHFAESRIFLRLTRPYVDLTGSDFTDWSFEKANPISPQKCRKIIRVEHREFRNN